MALPVRDGETELVSGWLEAPLLGVVSTFDPARLRDVARYVVGASAATLLLAAMNSQMLGPRAAGLLAGDQPPDPERGRSPAPPPRHALRRDRRRRR